MTHLIKRTFIVKRLIIILLYFIALQIKIPSVVHGEETRYFRFAVMGCVHFGVTDAKDYELAIKKIKEEKPDFVLFLGGMVDPMVEEPIESLWKKFDQITGELGIPVYNIFSNCHLMKLFIPNDRIAAMEKCFLERYKQKYYSFTYKNNFFICLDSESLFLGEKKDMVDKEQLDFLKRAISDSVKYDNVFLFVHSLSPIRKNIEEEDTENNSDESVWFKVIHPVIKGKIKHVFATHNHSFDNRQIDGVNYVFSGIPPCYKNIPSSFLHFLIINVTDKGVSTEIVPIKPIFIEENGRMDVSKKPQAATATAYKSYLTTVSDRESILQPSRVIKTLNIKSGMSILDIGAGAGFFTFRFAEALNGTGKVFATDADPEMIELIEDKIRKGSYTNVFPSFVKSDGVDQFYKQHLFDIIFLSEVFHCIWDAKSYFIELKPSLKKNGGRLYIIDCKNLSDFSEVEFDDFKKLARILIAEKKDFPVFQRLEKDVQYFIKNWKGEDIPLKIRTKIIRDFNRMLYDRWLWVDLLDYYFFKEKCYGYGKAKPFRSLLHSYDFRLAKWLVVVMDAEGIFNRKRKVLNETERKQLGTLNRILITGIFKTEKIGYFQGIDKAPIYLEKNSIISTLESAGFKFVRDHDFLTHHYFLEFERRD